MSTFVPQDSQGCVLFGDEKEAIFGAGVPVDGGLALGLFGDRNRIEELGFVLMHKGGKWINIYLK